MKYYRSAKILFFISLLYLHCCPHYCDKKKDVPILSDSGQARKVLPTHPSRAQNVPTQQDEREKVNIGIENSQIVQPSVEYVNSEIKVKDSKQFVDQIESIESLQVSSEKIKPKESGIKNSRHLNQQDPQVIDASKKSASMTSDILHTSKNYETEPLITIEQPIQSPIRDQVSNKLIKSSEPAIGQTVSHQKAGSSQLQDTNSIASKDIAHQQYDGMPSFDEWKKMMLAQQEKGGQKVLTPSPPGKKLSSQKRRRNYSSYECGAKIVGSNPEAESTSRILNELVDEYMLNPCKAKIWFVIELCETVQASQIELSNFELFSSCPKDFSVYSSDNFPTRDWVPLGTFTAAEQRVLQSFELKQEGFGKFIKVELNSHYGEEHYCPLSVVRIFGTSMVDEYEEMETLSSHPDIPDDDLDRLDIPVEDKKSNNIFGSATDAVMNIVKKAAEALGQKSVDDKQSNETSRDTQNRSESKICNLMDDSSKKCKDTSVGDKNPLPPLSTFLGSSSMQQSLFRLLHRCDQCSSPHVRYYSSAQPHCRFFQAALGPVSFQALCDWFKDHPLAIAHESPAPHRKDSSGGTFVITPTKSPPPQIMRIPTESDLALKSLLNDTLSIPYSDSSMTVNVSLSVKANKSASMQDKIILQSSIKPTQTIQNSQSKMYNDSIKTSIESLKENIKSSVNSVNEMLTKGSVSVPEKTESLTKESSSETATLSVSDYTVTSDLLTESEKAQISEFLSDTGAVSSEDLQIDLASTTELPPGFKSEDIHIETQEKLEPVPTAGSISAGQKESVFMRMSNRIKALEINMSLSSQYLQELSQRYRQQMDELQRRTIGTLNDTALKAAEVDVKQQEVLNNLQLQVANLTGTVELLIAERSLVFRQMIETHICLMFIEVIIMVTIISLCVRRINTAAKQTSLDRKTLMSPSRLSKRRNSVGSCTPPIARKVKKRSNSEENLNAEALIVEPMPVLLDPILKTKKRNKRRYKGNIQRSISHPHMQNTSSSTNSSHDSQHHNHSEGCMHTSTKAKQNPLTHACENCDNNMCAGMKFPNKERRLNGMPLQNLTNGSVLPEKSGPLNKKEKFSFKKLLKFQKRDSI